MVYIMDRMQNLSKEETSTISTLIILVLFSFSLVKYSVFIGGGGVSANYVYVLIPAVFWVLGIKRRLVKRNQVVIIVTFYTFIYIVGVPGDLFEVTNNPPVRRLASFTVFLFPLLFSFVEFKPCDIEIFKKSVIIASVYYSFIRISILLERISIDSLLDLKVHVGSQRYGFILCLGFFICLLSDKLIVNKWILLQRIIFCSFIFIGELLTFSRSTIVSHLGGFLFIVVLVLFVKKERFRLVYSIVPLVLGAFVFAAFQIYLDLDILKYYHITLIEPNLDFTMISSLVGGDARTSEGFRYHIFACILEYLATHPLLGSCYKGIYLVIEEYKTFGSTHNQYTDIFLRTGFLGGALWLFLIYRVFRFCRRDRGLQVGLVAILVYGLFHETFKQSQGSFVFAMLLSFSYMSSSSRQQSEASASATLSVT